MPRPAKSLNVKNDYHDLPFIRDIYLERDLL